MARVNLKSLRMRATIEDDLIIVDTHRELSNLVQGTAHNIAVSDFGREIYFSDGPTGVGGGTAKGILSVFDISNASAPPKRVLIEALTPKGLPAKKGR